MRDASLSVIVCAYNEGARLRACLHDLAAVLAVQERDLGPVEVVIVDDGSRDDTARIATECLPSFAAARLIRMPWNCGRGTAARAGVAVASGCTIVLIDIQLSPDIPHLPTVVRLLNGADAVLGRRDATGPTPWDRGVTPSFGHACRHLAQRLTAGGVAAHSYPFMAYRGEAAHLVFSLLRSTGAGFAVEAHFLSAAMGLRVVELTVGPRGGDRRSRPRDRRVVPLADLFRARRHVRAPLEIQWPVPAVSIGELSSATPADPADVLKGAPQPPSQPPSPVR